MRSLSSVDTHVTEEETAAIGRYDMDTLRLGEARFAYVVRELNRQAPHFVDYPLLALWEMGLCDLSMPFDGAEIRTRMVELAALGHRFTTYHYGVPKSRVYRALTDHGTRLSVREVVAPTTSAPELLSNIAGPKKAGRQSILTPTGWIWRRHVKSGESDETDRHDANCIAEALVGALAVRDAAVFLEKLHWYRWGYFFSSGLVDRLDNTLSGAHIVRPIAPNGTLHRPDQWR